MRSFCDGRRRTSTARPGVVVERLEPRLCLTGVSFQPAAMYNVPAGAQAIAVGDFNGDGWPDLAVVQNNAVSIWLNQRNGAFALAHNYTIENATGVAVGDFNRDGALDLVVTSGVDGLTDSVNILFGNGDGTFVSTPETIAVGDPNLGGLTAPVVGDFNDFNIPDIVVGEHGNGEAGPLNSGQVIVLLNNGDGTFASPVDYSVGTLGGDFGVSPTAIAIGDYNHDRWPDLAVSVSQVEFNAVTNQLVDEPGFVSLLYANTRAGQGLQEVPDGTFSQPHNFATGVNPSALTAADFNGDGVPDIATANSGDASNPGSVSVLLNDGVGNLLAASSLTAGDSPRSIVSADFDGNGTSDLAVSGGSGVLVRTGNGNGAFALSQTFQAGSGLGQMVGGDFNHDGQSDLAVVNSTGFAVLLNNTKPLVVPAVTAASYDFTHLPHTVSFTFNENVTASLAALDVQDLTTGLAVAPARYSFDTTTHTATFSFAGALDTGTYHATLLGSRVTDASGLAPADYGLSFFFQVGDVDHDGKVGFNDLVILARHYGESGATYADGDVDYDGKIGFNDLVIVARHYGQHVSTAAALTPTVFDDLLSLPLKRRGRIAH